MKNIGLISDTHSYLDPMVFEHFKEVDEIWHVGDIGNREVLDALCVFKPTRAVYGNIETQELRFELPEDLIFEIENLKVFMTHIGSLPGKYSARIKKIIKLNQPNLFICGHSHILRVIKDPTNQGLVYINPGAAGKHGFHHVRTIMRMSIENGKVTNLEVIELGPR
ncbi:metallophosphoesterase [Lacihabitans sp. LS3-19]|uniref:metallophosphoesterase family protein n=1 Tax=Lacihabitans sp. LS3-19 TaxID=2487335 RepID=UPI0020CE5360|nr:metallophosphoesterase family protein [Lacihabitans sp. LS3-19]MCP9767685.1 metallophosphoesterase [Lacihabitans sp. LS3-19]